MRPAAILDLFDPRGRLSRRGYGRFLVKAALASAGLLCLAIWLASMGLRGPAILAFGSNAFVALAILARTARRLHDRGRTAWWLGAWLVLYAASFAPLEQEADAHPIPVIAVVGFLVGFFAWFAIETVLRRGTDGPNRFGP